MDILGLHSVWDVFFFFVFVFCVILSFLRRQRTDSPDKEIKAPACGDQGRLNLIIPLDIFLL